MKIINKFKIKSDGDLLYCKIETRNFLKIHKPEYVENYVFALMELGTNILKYAGEGELWLIAEENEYMIAALDQGEGIEDINWALEEGNSSSGTLGIGLSSLNGMEKFILSVISLNEDDYNGTAVLFRPKNLKRDYVSIHRNYMDLKYGGDFLYKKGKFFIIGDVNGHGLKAQRSAEKIVRFFKEKVLSCVIVDDIFYELHEYIKAKSLRGVVLSIVEKTKYVNICGVGNLKILVKELGNVEIYSQKNGIVGEVFTGISEYSFELENRVICIFTDGIEDTLARKIFLKSDDVFLCAVSAVYFSKTVDDKTLLILKEGK